MFKKTKETLKNVKGNLWKLLKISWKTDKKLTAGYYGTAGIAALFPIIGSFLYKLYIDSLIANLGITPSIPLVILALLGSRYLSNWIWDFVSWVLKETYFDYLLRYKLQNYFSRMFARKMSVLDLQHLEDSKTLDLINKAKDTLTWRPPDFLRAFSYLFTNIVSYVSSFLLLGSYGWHLPLIISLFGIPRLYLRAKLGALQWSIWGSGAPEVRKLWYLQWLLTQKHSIVESKIFGSQTGFLKKYENIQDELFERNEKPVRKFIKIASLPQFFEAIVLFTFAVVKLPQVLSGSVSVGDFTFYIDMLDRVANSVSGMVGNLGWMYENNLYVNHFFEVMGLKKVIKSPANPIAIPEYPNPPHLEFKNVSFRYPGSKKFALKNVSFIVESGKNIALVGKNGAGKTTIVKLVCRFYDVTEGVILINGVNIKEVNLDDWYKYLGTLFQEFTKYDFTVRENIIQGDLTHFDEERMHMAAKKSGADKFINGLPEKYEQLLGKQFEGGIELSIGQWQKIAIARAFYAGAPILILDEPTSAIDAETEYKIFKNLDTEYKNKSLLLISHRFSTVRHADKIIVISKGEIKEEGTHAELMDKKGMYAKMFQKQAEGYR